LEQRLEIGGHIEEVILVISGTARHTWQPAHYALEIHR
jgi:hypothetical protein